MSRWEKILWAIDFLFSALGWFLGGPYASVPLFLVGGLLILSAITTKEEEVPHQGVKKTPVWALDHQNQPYRPKRNWRKPLFWAMFIGLMLTIAVGVSVRFASGRWPSEDYIARKWFPLSPYAERPPKPPAPPPPPALRVSPAAKVPKSLAQPLKPSKPLTLEEEYSAMTDGQRLDALSDLTTSLSEVGVRWRQELETDKASDSFLAKKRGTDSSFRANYGRNYAPKILAWHTVILAPYRGNISAPWHETVQTPEDVDDEVNELNRLKKAIGGPGHFP